MAGRFRTLEPREATPEEILSVHTAGYLRRIEATRGCGHTQLDPDTHVSSESYRVAKLAAGGLNGLVDALFSGGIDSGFALVRPPGHHAEADRGMGFCIYNNVAVAARYAQKKGLARKVLIVDWDLHHGNGTQHTFEADDTVLYFSTHQYPFYPGTGRAEEVGRDKGAGRTVNVPLPGGQGDADFLYIYESLLGPIAEQFQPDLVLVSAGFDIYSGDPLGSMRVTEQGFGDIMGCLLKMAGTLCRGRILATLEGGYHVEGEAQGIRSVLNTLSGQASPLPAGASPSRTTERIVEQVRACHRPYWKI
jgi:acetoin utilization deacetylase AcuC-like enzyme